MKETIYDQLSELRDMRYEDGVEYAALRREYAALTAENARLRAALDEIIASPRGFTGNPFTAERCGECREMQIIARKARGETL